MRIVLLALLSLGCISLTAQQPPTPPPAPSIQKVTNEAVTTLKDANVVIAEQKLQIAQLQAQVAQMQLQMKELQGALSAVTNDASSNSAIQAAQVELEKARKEQQEKK